MTKEKILLCLCAYDERNPYYIPYDEDDLLRKPIDCSCDNCFYRRKEMAEFILTLLELPTNDKDIFDQAILAMEEMYGSGCDSEIDAYFRGAKWMQKQLKQRQ